MLCCLAILAFLGFLLVSCGSRSPLLLGISQLTAGLIFALQLSCVVGRDAHQAEAVQFCIQLGHFTVTNEMLGGLPVKIILGVDEIVKAFLTERGFLWRETVSTYAV